MKISAAIKRLRFHWRKKRGGGGEQEYQDQEFNDFLVSGIYFVVLCTGTP